MPTKWIKPKWLIMHPNIHAKTQQVKQKLNQKAKLENFHKGSSQLLGTHSTNTKKFAISKGCPQEIACSLTAELGILDNV